MVIQILSQKRETSIQELQYLGVSADHSQAMLDYIKTTLFIGNTVEKGEISLNFAPRNLFALGYVSIKQVLSLK